MKSAFLIAAPTSGSGKTTIARGLMALLTSKGMKVQPFKCGPDYIDTKFHASVCGRPSINLDTFMASPEHVRELFTAYGADADVCIVEGMMGLFDGYDRDKGSAYEIAKTLDIPVVLVVDAKSAAYSVAALLQGFLNFRKDIRFAGIIFNKVGSARHFEMLQQVCDDLQIKCLGYLPKDALLEQGSRYLGLDFSEQPETQKLITSVEYTSKDGTVKITLPDNTWKVTQDADEMRVFSSGSDAMINIVHASTESAMKTLSIQKTEQDLNQALTKQYSDANAYEIQSFETKKVENIDIYRYVVKYNAAARMWAYSVTYGIVAPDQAYVITGTVTNDNPALLKAVEDAVDSFTVLKDEELKNIAALTTVKGTTDTSAAPGKKADATTAAAAASSQENSSLQSYGTGSVMYASDTVNVRSGPGTDTNIIGGFAAGNSVTVTGETNGWYQVSVGGQTGYIRKDLLSQTQNASASQPAQQAEASDGTASVNSVTPQAEAEGENATATNYGSAVTMYTADGVNVRSQPSTGSDVNSTLGLGTAVTVIGETDNWYVVSTGSGTGYISKALLSDAAPAGSASSGTDSSGQGSSTGSSDTGTSSGSTTDTGTSSGSTTDTGASSGGTSSGTSAAAGSSGYVSGVVTGTSSDGITIQGDDGNVYNVDTGSAEISASDGIYSGLYVNVGYTVNEDGSLTASAVTG